MLSEKKYSFMKLSERWTMAAPMNPFSAAHSLDLEIISTSGPRSPFGQEMGSCSLTRWARGPTSGSGATFGPTSPIGLPSRGRNPAPPRHSNSLGSLKENARRIKSSSGRAASLNSLARRNSFAAFFFPQMSLNRLWIASS